MTNLQQRILNILKDAKQPRRYFIDSEFEDTGSAIIPISLGIVSDDDRELYLINKDYMWAYNNKRVYTWNGIESKAIDQTPDCSFIRNNVLPYISEESIDTYGWEMDKWPEFIHDFMSEGNEFLNRDDVELWGYYAAYDHVVLAQTFGRMINLPQPVPMFTKEIMQLPGAGHNKPKRPVEWPEHHALYDAKYQKLLWEAWQ